MTTTSSTPAARMARRTGSPRHRTSAAAGPITAPARSANTKPNTAAQTTPTPMARPSDNRRNPSLTSRSRGAAAATASGRVNSSTSASKAHASPPTM